LLFAGLDLALVKHRPKGLAATFKKANREFGSFAGLVFPAYHLPSLFGANFLLTLRAFSHNAPFFQRLSAN